MACPDVTARGVPVGCPLKDGHSTKIAFARDPDVSFWEKTVKPLGRDGGDSINTTTMHNVRYRTKAPRSLVDTTDATAKVAYDPAVGDQIDELINQEGGITLHYPDGTTESFWGYLKSFMPDDMQEGNQPEAEITIVSTNVDPANCGIESGPCIVSVPGT